MRGISKTVARWFSIDLERGVTAIEYGLIASLIAIAIIVGITLRRHESERTVQLHRRQSRGALSGAIAVAYWRSICSQRGATAMEYGLIASLIAIAIIVGLTLVGTNLNGLLSYLGNKFVAP